LWLEEASNREESTGRDMGSEPGNNNYTQGVSILMMGPAVWGTTDEEGPPPARTRPMARSHCQRAEPSMMNH